MPGRSVLAASLAFAALLIGAGPGPVGPTTDGSVAQRTHWSTADRAPYSAPDWWYEGNFLLDGHDNATFADGTFSLQMYGGGRLRWLFGDGANPGPGGVWSVGAHLASGTPSLLDGGWHQVTLVRRFAVSPGAQLELWIDGALVDTETTLTRPDLRVWWNAWSGFPAGQSGWFWGAEKQAAIGVLAQYEDYKGLLDELRFWARAKLPLEISSGFAAQGSGDESGLIASYTFSEAAGSLTCGTAVALECMTLVGWSDAHWAAEDAPVTASPPPPVLPPLVGPLALSKPRIRQGTATTLSFSLSKAARVTVTIDRLVPARVRGTRCDPSAATGRRCTRAMRRGTIVRARGPGTSARITLPGRLGGRVLRVGRYRVTVVARDAGGRLSPPRRTVLTVRSN